MTVKGPGADWQVSRRMMHLADIRLEAKQALGLETDGVSAPRPPEPKPFWPAPRFANFTTHMARHCCSLGRGCAVSPEDQQRDAHSSCVANVTKCQLNSTV